MADPELTAEQQAALDKLTDEQKEEIVRAQKLAAKFTSPMLQHLAMVIYLADKKYCNNNAQEIAPAERTLNNFKKSSIHGDLDRVFSGDMRKKFLPAVYMDDVNLLGGVFPIASLQSGENQFNTNKLGAEGRKIADNIVQVLELCKTPYTPNNLNKLSEIFANIEKDIFPNPEEEKAFFDIYLPGASPEEKQKFRVNIIQGYFFHLKSNLITQTNSPVEDFKLRKIIDKPINMLQNHLLEQSTKSLYQDNVDKLKKDCMKKLISKIDEVISSNGSIERMISNFFSSFPVGEKAAQFEGLQKELTEFVHNDPRVQAQKLLLQTKKALKSYKFPSSPPQPPQGWWERIQKFFRKKELSMKDGVASSLKILEKMKVDMTNPKKTLEELATVIKSVNNAAKAQGHNQIIADKVVTKLTTLQTASQQQEENVEPHHQAVAFVKLQEGARNLNKTQPASDREQTPSRDAGASMSLEDFLKDSENTVDKGPPAPRP